MTQQPSAPVADRPRRHTVTRSPLFLAVDLVLVTVFAAIGRRAHAEDPLGVLETAWPFLVGALVGWLIVTRSGLQRGMLFMGTGIWLATVVVGMALRAVTGQGTAITFVLVALVVLGVFLVGYRALILLTFRLRGTR